MLNAPSGDVANCSLSNKKEMAVKRNRRAPRKTSLKDPGTQAQTGNEKKKAISRGIASPKQHHYLADFEHFTTSL